MMKKTILFLSTIVLGLLFSCQKDGASLLDRSESGILTEATVFASAKYTKLFLTDIYRRLPYDWDNNVYLDADTDDGEGRAWWSWVNTTQVGAYNPTSMPDKFKRWADYYAAIRACNLFISKIDSVPVDPEQYMSTVATRTRMKNEAVCLEAFFYTELVRWYGGVPIITKVLDQGTPELLTKRANLKEMKDFILPLCDSAVKNLPAQHLDADFGRMTSGVAKAIKARLLLQLASPLFNSATDAFNKPTQLSPWSWGNYDANRWNDAAVAAKAVMDHKSEVTSAVVYSLVNMTGAANYFGNTNTYPGSLKALGWYSVFVTKGTATNKEIMLSYLKKGLTNELEKWQLPGSMAGGDASYTLPTYNYAACFENNLGVPVYQTDDYGQPLLDANGQFLVNPLSGFDPQNPYANRENRFYLSLWYNQAKYSNVTFNTWHGEDGSVGREFLAGYAHTGVFLRKFEDPKNTSLSGGTVQGQTYHDFPIFRLDEMLLDYAEATNEFLADGASRTNVISTLDLIRLRADLPTTQTTFTKNGWDVNNQKQMRKFIRNERRIELAFENQRFFDVRRWLIGEKTQQIAYEHDVLKKLNGTFVYSIKVWEKRVFRPQDNLMCIPQSEINNNPNLEQNPGW